MALAKNHDRAGLIKALLLVSVVGVHAALLAGILASARVEVSIKTPEPTDVRFVEIAPDISQAAPAPAQPAPESQPSSEPVPEPQAPPETTPPEPEPHEPAPEPEQPPEPEPSTEPEPEPEPEPPPEATSEPEPGAITLPPKVAPEPPARTQLKTEAKPKPKPKPKAKPKLKAKPRPRRQPELSPVLPQTEAAQSPTAPTAQGPAAAAAPPPASKSASDQPRLIGKVDYLGSRPHPVYPRVSMRRGETGRVVVRVFISRQGLVEKATVRTSSGFSRLDESAINAVRAARFKPYTENGVPYPAIADIPFDFVL